MTPSHQFPTGAVLPCRGGSPCSPGPSAGAYVVEDDYDGEYRHGTPGQSLQGSIAADALYVGTFALFPALRLGYLIVPPSLRRAFRAAK